MLRRFRALRWYSFRLSLLLIPLKWWLGPESSLLALEPKARMEQGFRVILSWALACSRRGERSLTLVSESVLIDTQILTGLAARESYVNWLLTDYLMLARLWSLVRKQVCPNLWMGVFRGFRTQQEERMGVTVR